MTTTQPGPELDAEIARAVFGKEAAVYPGGAFYGPGGRIGRVPSYSRDQAIAMSLLDVWPHDWRIARKDDRYIVTLCRPTTLPLMTAECLEQSNESLALAICYVRLRAVNW